MVIRFVLAVGWTLLTMIIRLLFWPVGLLSEHLDRKLRRLLVTKVWSRPFFYFIGMRLRVTGPLPQAPFFLVANHLSYVDPWLLNGLLGCVFVAKGEIARWPVLGFLSKSLHAIFINRTDKRDTVRINRLIRHALEQGDAVVVFAESRISRGLDVQPFKSALIEPAVANGIPVHYASIHYETLPGSPPASDIVGWWRSEPILWHFRRLLRQRGFIATIRFGEEPLAGSNRKELARSLHEAVCERFTPVA